MIFWIFKILYDFGVVTICNDFILQIYYSLLKDGYVKIVSKINRKSSILVTNLLHFFYDKSKSR